MRLGMCLGGRYLRRVCQGDVSIEGIWVSGRRKVKLEVKVQMEGEVKF